MVTRKNRARASTLRSQLFVRGEFKELDDINLLSVEEDVVKGALEVRSEVCGWGMTPVYFVDEVERLVIIHVVLFVGAG